MKFRILGPIDVRNENGAVALGGNKPRAVLAVLLLHANEPVSAERLALALWGEDAPGSAVKTVQVHVSRLRKALGDPDAVATTAAGYRLRVRPDELDSHRFERLVEEGRRALASGQPEEASALLGEALSLWRGPPLAELAAEPFAAAEIARLQEQRVAAIEARIEADLAAGRHDQLISELQQLVADNPTRERLAGQLMLALYRSGRQSEALEAYVQARGTLISEIGVEPGPELRRLQDAILRQDASLEPQAPVAELPSELDAATAPALVGRDEELAWLRERWERARSGSGTLVAILGVRGIGKTRLAAQLAGEAHRAGATVLHVSGTGRTEAVLVALRRAGQPRSPTLVVVAHADDAAPEVLARLAELAGALAGAAALVLVTGADPELADRLGAPDALVLEPLDAEAVSLIAAGYAPGVAAGDVPAEWLLEASGGVPLRLHEVAGQWARREAARKVGAAASRAAAGRAELRSIEAELTGDVVELQAAGERILPVGDDDAPVVCPFKGLASFDPADAQYFFGRERLVAELVARLVGAPLLAVVGPSGSGKSSVTKAGLLPALAGGVLPGSDTWAQVLIRPGEHPLRELRDAMADHGDGRGMVIAVDQFEETFTTCRDEDERAAFIAELAGAAENRRRPAVVVIALRADFYGRCAAYPGLAELVASNHVLVGAMRRDELRRAVERPALRAGLLVDAELADALVADVKDEPGALPLLSTALLELWQRRDGRRLRYDAYERTGGVRGAVARLAEDAFAQLDEAQQKVARSVLMRLAGEGAAGSVERRRVALDELEIERNEDVARVVALLTDRRLLTVSEGTIEFAHEALLREWPRLRGWIDEDRDGLRIQRSLSAGAHEWERLGRDEGALFQGSRLSEVIEWNALRNPPLNALEREFLGASEARRERERAQRRRRLVLAFSGLVTVLVALAIVAVVSVSQSREARRQRDVEASRAIAARSASFVATDPRLSLALAMEALKRSPTNEAQNALRQATLADRTRSIWTVSRQGPANGLAVSRDRSLLATASEDGTVRVRRVDDGRVLTTVTGKGPALAVSFSPDGRRLAIAGLDGEVAIADVHGGGGHPLLRRPGEGAYPRSVEFSPDGKRLLVATADGKVGILSLLGQRKLHWLPGSGTARTSAHFSHDGTKVVAASEDGVARIWPVAGGSPSRLVHRNVAVLAAAFSPDDTRVATAGSDGVIRVWNAKRPGAARKIAVDTEALGSVRFSADGHRLVTVGQDGAIRVVDVRGGPLLAEMRGHFGPATDAAFLRGLNDIVSIGEDGTLRRWTMLPVLSLPGMTPAGAPSFSPDGTRVVSGFAGGAVRIWDPATRASTHLLSYPTASRAAYSGDGSHIVSASMGGSVSLWNVARHVARPVPSPPGEKYGLAIDRTGSRVAFSTVSGVTRVERPDGTGRVDLPGHSDLVNALAFSPDGRHVVSASADHTARIWNAATGRPELSLPHNEAVIDAQFSRDARDVVTASSDGTVRVWPLAGGPPAVHYGHVGLVNTVAFDPTGERVVSAGTDGTVRIWNAAGGETLVVLHTHGENALGARFSPDGRRVVSSGADGAIQITDCEVCGSLAQVLRLARSRPKRVLSSAERQRLLLSEG